MSEFLIRPMTAADLVAVMTLERAGFSHPWSEKMFLDELNNPQARIDLLWCADRLAGYLCSWFVCGELHILNLVTAPSFRRRGVAGRLLDHAVGTFFGQDLERVLLEVRSSNRAAIALYENYGFRHDAVRRGYYPDGEDALLMSLIPSTLPSLRQPRTE